MAWQESPYERRSIVRGMRVRAEDGSKLGHVAFIGQEHLFIRRWPFSLHWRELPLSSVRRVQRGAVVVEGRGGIAPADPRLHGEVPTQTYPLAEPPGAGAVHP